MGEEKHHSIAFLEQNLVLIRNDITLEGQYVLADVRNTRTWIQFTTKKYNVISYYLI